MNDENKTKEQLIEELTVARHRIAELETTAQEFEQTKRTLAAQKELFENLVAVARAVAQGITLQETLQDALDVAAKLTGADAGSLFLLNESGMVTHSLLALGKEKLEIEQFVGRLMDKGLAGWVIKHRRAALIPDTDEDERWLPLPGGVLAARSALSVPITSNATLLGVLTLTHIKPNRFTSEQVGLMQAAADQMALAVRNAQIYEAQRRLAEHQVTLYELIRTIGGILEIEEVLDVAADVVAQLTGWNAVAILTPDTPPTHLVVRAAAGQLAAAIGWRIDIEQGITSRAYRTAQIQHAPDVSRDADYVLSDPQLRSELSIPIRRGKRVMGVLDVESTQLNDFSVDDVLLAESLTDALALAMDNARYLAELSCHTESLAKERSRLRALIEASRDGIILIGMDRHILVINAHTLDLLQLLGQPDDWTNRTMQEFIMAIRHHNRAVARATLREMRRIKYGDEPPAEGEFEIASRKIRWQTLPVMAENTPLGRLVVLRDVTEERRLEKFRDDLTHTMVHDLRSPLGVISGTLQMLERSMAGNLSLDQQQMFDIATGSAQRMLKLVNSILDINRLEEGKMPLEWTRINLFKLISNTLQTQTPLITSKELQLEQGLSSALPLVRGDINLIERVLQNLLDNAVKFTPRGGNIRVNARVVNEVSNEIVVSVSNTGSTIPVEIREHLFRKFVRGRKKGSGSGLGLAFCKMAVEAHGGQIWAEQGANNGTTISFTLPIFPK